MRKERRRDMIAETAKSLFASNGFHGTTMEDISKACGIAHRTLYLHFRSKQEIFHVLMLQVLDRIQDLMEPIKPDDPRISTSVRDEFFNFIKEKNLQIFRAVNDDRDLFRIILREAPGLSSEIDAILARINDVMLRQIATELTIGQRLGILGQVGVKFAAQMALGTMLVVIVAHLLEGVPPDLESLAQRVTEVQHFGAYGKPLLPKDSFSGRRHDPGCSQHGVAATKRVVIARSGGSWTRATKKSLHHVEIASLAMTVCRKSRRKFKISNVSRIEFRRAQRK
jgi:AcrR family transcriptional regulator